MWSRAVYLPTFSLSKQHWLCTQASRQTLLALQRADTVLMWVFLIDLDFSVTVCGSPFALELHLGKVIST